MSRARRTPRHTVTVTIAGERHVLRSDAPPEYTEAVAAHVDSTVRALGDAQPVQPHRTVILAALFITDELFRARREIDRLKAEVDARAGGLAQRLEDALQPPAAHDAEGDEARDLQADNAAEPDRPGPPREPSTGRTEEPTAAERPTPEPVPHGGTQGANGAPPSPADPPASSAGGVGEPGPGRAERAPAAARQLELDESVGAGPAPPAVDRAGDAERRQAEPERNGDRGDDQGPQRSLL